MRLNQGDEEARCRDLFTALWVPDLFMQKVEKDEDWYLMCPNESPGLADVWGENFSQLYNSYVEQGKYKRKVKARDVWNAVLKSQIETGTPYMCYKDSVNSKSNQMNIGVIKSSNLCVAPETKVLTKKGYIKISSLVGETVEIWNGREWSDVVVEKTSDSSKLVRVNMSDGTFIECTEYHKFYVIDGTVKSAKELIIGDELIEWTDVDGSYKPSVSVVSIEDNNRFDATYCFNEPKRHMGIFNGIIAGNCTEIMEVSTPDETAVCNLASLCLPTFVTNGSFDFDKLYKVTRVVTRNLNRVIDRNYYPTETAKKSNLRHRPIGIGVQGLADVFMMLGLTFDEPTARNLNKRIFEMIYYAAVTESCQLAKEDGMYETCVGSPAKAHGLLPTPDVLLASGCSLPRMKSCHLLRLRIRKFRLLDNPPLS